MLIDINIIIIAARFRIRTQRMLGMKYAWEMIDNAPFRFFFFPPFFSSF